MSVHAPASQTPCALRLPAAAAALPHPQAEREAGPDGHCHRIQLVWRDARSRQRRVNAAVDGGLVRLLSQLRHYAAPGCVDVGLRGQGLAQDAATGAHYCHARVVTAALDAQDQAGTAGGTVVRCACCSSCCLVVVSCCCCCCRRFRMCSGCVARAACSKSRSVAGCSTAAAAGGSGAAAWGSPRYRQCPLSEAEKKAVIHKEALHAGACTHAAAGRH